jgi:hypothetical protein
MPIQPLVQLDAAEAALRYAIEKGAHALRPARHVAMRSPSAHGKALHADTVTSRYISLYNVRTTVLKKKPLCLLPCGSIVIQGGPS